MRVKLIVVFALSTVFILTACGGSPGTPAGSGDSNGSGGATVSGHDIAGKGVLLADSAGRTLYFADQESDGTIRCKADCLAVWLPLVAPQDGKPTAGQGVTGALATKQRDDNGVTQVTYDGKPLYTFSIDKQSGDATGDGAKDSFGGTEFVWHAIRTGTGPMTSTEADPGAPPGGGY